MKNSVYFATYLHERKYITEIKKKYCFHGDAVEGLLQEMFKVFVSSNFLSCETCLF